jgi:hypothetical protein
MKKLFTLCFVLAACGGSKVTEPPPLVVNGTVFILLDISNCSSYTIAEYNVDSLTVGTEAIARGVPSKGYTVPSGLRSVSARLTKPGSNVGLWPYHDRVTVPKNGTVTANLRC